MKGQGKPKTLPKFDGAKYVGKKAKDQAQAVTDQMRALPAYTRIQKREFRSSTPFSVDEGGHPTKGFGTHSRHGQARSNRSSRKLRTCKAQHKARMVMRRHG